MQNNKPFKLKKCRVCGGMFEPVRAFQNWCSVDCGVALAKQKQAKEARTKTKKEKSEFQQKDKKWLMANAVFHCHEYIRMRDEFDPCISCGRTTAVQWHAGHYRPAGNNSALRFHELNIHKQCSQCNNYHSANKHGDGGGEGYIVRLTRKIGADAVRWLDNSNDPHRWTVDALREVISHYKTKKKELKKNREKR